MTRFSVVTIIFACCALILIPETALTAEILVPEISIRGNEIIVYTGLSHIEDIETTIKSGVEKEIVFTIELFKVWNYWPDEFVVSKKIRRIIKYDNLREHYLATFFNEKFPIERTLRDFTIMKKMIFMVDGVSLVKVKELDPGSYYVRVVAESKSRELPSVIGLLMLFIPEVEMSLARESHRFNIGENG